MQAHVINDEQHLRGKVISRGFFFFFSPVYTGPSEHNRLISGLRKWVCFCFQPCGEACAGAVLVLQRCAWHQNLVHCIGLNVRTEVQPIAVPKEQKEWDKNTEKPPQFGLTSTPLISAAC